MHLNQIQVQMQMRMNQMQIQVQIQPSQGNQMQMQGQMPHLHLHLQMQVHLSTSLHGICVTGLTLLYMTAPSPDSQKAMMHELSVARQLTDQSLGDIAEWPGSSEEGDMFRSYYLFAAVLDNTRTRIKPSDYYRQELDVRMITLR